MGSPTKGFVIHISSYHIFSLISYNLCAVLYAMLHLHSLTFKLKAVTKRTFGFLCFSLVGYPPFYEERKDMDLVKQIKGGHYSFPAEFWKGISEEGTYHWVLTNQTADLRLFL